MNQCKLLLRSIRYSWHLIYRSSKLLVLPYFIIRLIEPSLTLLQTFMFKMILDNLITADVNIAAVLFCAALYGLSLILAQGISTAGNHLESVIFWQKAAHLYECELAEKMSQLPLSLMDSSKGRDMIDDVKYANNTVILIFIRITTVISSLYTIIVALVTLLRFNVLFSLLFLLLTIPGIILNHVFDKKAEALRMKTAPDIRKFAYYRWMATDAWPAKDVRMYDLTEPIKTRYHEEKNEYLRANKRLDKQKTKCYMLAELIKRSGEIAFTIYIVYAALTSQITIGDVALYSGFALTLSNTFEWMLDTIVLGYTRTTEIIGRVLDFFAMETEKKRGDRALERFESITFDNVFFKYPHTEKDVLSGVSFTVNRGEKVSIVGINGSGKSTMIKLMLGLYEIESGQILINGYPMSDYDIKNVRKQFSVLFQNFVQYPLTLRENVASSALDKSEDSDAIKHVLSLSGVYDDLQPKLEHGLDSYMTRQFDDKGTELSKGQWQKIALSRAYFKNAAIVIFDEPSSALDAEAEDRIFRNFEEISDGKTGIMISHRISGARMSDRIIVLDGGKITEQGTHDELLAQNGLYAHLYELQREKYTLKEESCHE